MVRVHDMPSILRSLFKSLSPNSGQQKSGPLPQGVDFFSPPPQSPRQLCQSGRDEDLQHLLGLLHQVIEDNPTRDAAGLVRALKVHSHGDDTTFARLTQLLDRMSLGGVSEVTPFHSGLEASSKKMQRAESSARASGKSKGRSSGATRDREGQLKGVIEGVSAAFGLAGKLVRSSIGKADPNRGLLNRICTLLEAQREELLDLRPYAVGGIPALATLKEMYLKVATGLEEVHGKKERDAADSLESLVQVLGQGPDYLIVIAIIEAVVWHAEVVDPNYGGEMRGVLDRAATNQTDVAVFRHAAESLVAISSALPRDLLDDQEAVEAYKAIGALIKQLQIRAAVSRAATPVNAPILPPSRFSVSFLGYDVPDTATGSPLALSPLPSLPGSGSATPNQDAQFSNINSALELQARYGTGVIPTPPKSLSLAPTPVSATPKPPPSPSDTDSEGPEVWEYRGNLLTRSALSLVLRQEALAKADSSGQYAGEVSWDDVRNAWIPKWAEKAKAGDLADGELPSLNPADFKVKRKDAWGNTIGWRNGVMYYSQEPSFDSVPD